MPAPVPARVPARRLPLPSATRVLTGAAGAGAGLLVLVGPASAAAGWTWPLADPVVVSRPFEAPTGPYGPGHRGVDLAAPVGTPVRAAAAGTVVVAGEVAGVPVVVVAHGVARTSTELRTTYQPVRASVAVGERVAQGQPVGSLGEWPGHCSPGCLHWGLRRGVDYLDPTALVDGPARLLPVGAPVPVGTHPGTGDGTPRSPAPVVRVPTSGPLVANPDPSHASAARDRSGLPTPAPTALAAMGAVIAGAGVLAARSRARRAAARDGPGG